MCVKINLYNEASSTKQAYESADGKGDWEEKSFCGTGDIHLDAHNFEIADKERVFVTGPSLNSRQ